MEKETTTTATDYIIDNVSIIMRKLSYVISPGTKPTEKKEHWIILCIYMILAITKSNSSILEILIKRISEYIFFFFLSSFCICYISFRHRTMRTMENSISIFNFLPYLLAETSCNRKCFQCKMAIKSIGM